MFKLGHTGGMGVARLEHFRQTLPRVQVYLGMGTESSVRLSEDLRVLAAGHQPPAA